MKKLFTLLVLLVGVVVLSGCELEADTVEKNLTIEADSFNVYRKIVFINGITDNYLFEITGYCSIEADMADRQLEVICKIGEGEYEKHFLGLADNISYIVIQEEASFVSGYHRTIVFRPETIIPNVKIDTEGN